MERPGEPLCLRCKTVALTELEDAGPHIRFFECPKCRRHYALAPGRSLTFRWLQPITLPLYAVMFDADPVGRAGDVAAQFVEKNSTAQLRRMVEEIRLELADPTQRLRDIHDGTASEELSREYLRRFADRVERLLAAKSA